MDDYRDEVLTAIRNTSPRLALCTRNQLIELYHEFGEAMFSAGWPSYHPKIIMDFCAWATVAPCDRRRPANAEADRPAPAGPI